MHVVCKYWQMKWAFWKALRMSKYIAPYKSYLAEILENPSKSSLQNLETPFFGTSELLTGSQKLLIDILRQLLI